MFWLDTELQPKDGGYQLVWTGNYGLILSYQGLVCLFTVDVPGQMNCGLGPAGSAVNPHVVTNLVARLPTRYVRIFIGKN